MYIAHVADKIVCSFYPCVALRCSGQEVYMNKIDVEDVNIL